MVLGHAQPLGRGLGAVGKIVGRGHELVSAMLLEQVGDPVAPPAAADQAERDFGVRFRGRDLAGLDDQQSRGSGRSAGQEIAAAEVFVRSGMILDGCAWSWLGILRYGEGSWQVGRWRAIARQASG